MPTIFNMQFKLNPAISAHFVKWRQAIAPTWLWYPV
jgi:hypothetical protein